MKKLELTNKEVIITTDLTQLSISEFENAVSIFNKEYSTSIERYIDLIEVMTNLSISEIEDLDIFDFKKIIDVIETIKFHDFEKKFINEIQIGGVTYKSKSTDSEYKFSVKEMFIINDVIVKNPENYLLDLISIIFKEVDAEGKIVGNLEPESIAKRKEIFKDIKMDIVGPYLISLSEYFLSNSNVK